MKNKKSNQKQAGKIKIVDEAKYLELTGKTIEEIPANGVVEHNSAETAKLIEKKVCEYTKLQKEILRDKEIAEENQKRDKENKTREYTQADILLNPINTTDRFGIGYKNDKLYYGIVCADKTGQIIPGVVLPGKQFVFGSDNLKAIGFNFSEDLSSVGMETWNNIKLHNYLTTPTFPLPTTKELIDEILESHQKVVYHPNVTEYLIEAAYVLQSYIYPVFKKIARICVRGLPESGKSTDTDFLAKLIPNVTTSADASKSAIYRTVTDRAGGVVIDNMDKRNEEELNEFGQIYDTSYEAGRIVLRCDKKNKSIQPVPFDTFSPMMVNCVYDAWMKDSSRTRTVFINMYKNPDVKLISLEDIKDSVFLDIQNKLRIWALENYERISKISSKLNEFSNRDKDIAHPILAILKDADENYFKRGKEFLKTNFEENHGDEEFTDESDFLLALWKILLEKHKQQPKETIFSIRVKEVGAFILKEEGVEEYLTFGENTTPNQRYPTELKKKCRFISQHMKNIPYLKITKTHNLKAYHYNIIAVAKFLKMRGIEIGTDWEKLLAKTLLGYETITDTNPTNPINPTNPTNPINSTNPTNPTNTTNNTNPNNNIIEQKVSQVSRVSQDSGVAKEVEEGLAKLLAERDKRTTREDDPYEYT